MADELCGEIMEPFLRAIADRTDLPSIQIIGGNGSAALLHEDTVIDLAARTIEAPASCDLPRYRPDRSLRDMDTLVLSTSPNESERVQSLAEELLGGELTVNIFGLKTTAELDQQQRQPLRSSARVFLGDRYVNAGAGTEPFGFKALYPFKVPITAATLETFQLSVDGLKPIPTSHPGATILSNLTRSISGLRAKDADKVARLSHQVLSRYPEIRAWIHDGPGKDTLDLARVLHTLREPRQRPQTLRVCNLLQVEPYRLAELENHDGFMAAHLPPAGRRGVIELAHAKSRVLGTYESKPAVVTFWQKHIEDRLQRVVHNDL